MEILYVEDEIALAGIVTDSLRFKGYTVNYYTNCEDALVSFKHKKPDIILLDVMMVEKDGFAFATEIREVDQLVPIIFITARTQTADVIRGFEIGANDYLKKPFSIDELIVRINFHLKGKKNTPSKYPAIGRYRLDLVNHQLTIGSKSQPLSYRESELLRKLSEKRNDILKRSDILQELWDIESFFTGRSLDVFISRLRTYLQDDPQVSIKTIRGVGYMMLVKQE